MEKIKKQVNQSMQDLKKKSMNRKCKCVECDDDITNPQDFPPLCEKCRKKKKEQDVKKKIDKFMFRIPPKFREIECDRKDLIDELYEKSVFITGKVGVGKSVLAAGIAKKYIREGTEIMWLSFPALIMELQNAYKKEQGKTPFDIAQEVARYDGVLILDDIGVREKSTPFMKQITYFIINHREQYLLTSLITSNYSLAQLDKYIDSRISSRIAGMCKCIKLTGKDRRISNE